MAEGAFEMEKMEPRGGFSWRRNSTGNINTKISVVLPRYLSAPLASCHDSCKYGGKRSNNGEEAARIPKRFASKLQKKPLSEEEEEGVYLQTEKNKFAGTLIKKQKATSPAMIRQDRVVLGHGNVKRVVSVSAKHHICSSKTKGISRSSQKGCSTVQTSEVRETRTQHRNSRIPRNPNQTRQRKLDSADEETLFVIKEHKENSTNHSPSCCSEETEVNSEQENGNSLPRKLVFRRGKIVEGTPLKDGDISPRKLVVQYIVVEGNKKESSEVFDSTTMEDDTANTTPAAENVFGNNVKTLIGAFESVISLRDDSSSPAAADNMFSNVKALISAFESVISQKLSCTKSRDR